MAHVTGILQFSVDKISFFCFNTSNRLIRPVNLRWRVVTGAARLKRVSDGGIETAYGGGEWTSEGKLSRLGG